jgi:hyaluronoglucosaminidase
LQQIGVIEGFFGPSWSMEERLSYASFLSQHGGTFYIYAPKEDSRLRRQWREEWNEEYLNKLRTLTNCFQSSKISFGIGFSPFGIGTNLSLDDKNSLRKKMIALNEMNIDFLGLFFDDMPINDNLAQTQLETVNVVQKHFKKKIIFCPSYYSTDPILDKVFGPRPTDYLETIGRDLPEAVSIAWTGPKVISNEISVTHLTEVQDILKRKPFLWDNLYANDGPKNCKFLKFKLFEGRSKEILLSSEGIGLNMMNQPELSKLLFLSSRLVLDGEDPENAFHEALRKLFSQNFSTFILQHKEVFTVKGLDSLSATEKKDLKSHLKLFSEPAAQEIVDWLEGKYLVGTECLTD